MKSAKSVLSSVSYLTGSSIEINAIIGLPCKSVSSTTPRSVKDKLAPLLTTYNDKIIPALFTLRKTIEQNDVQFFFSSKVNLSARKLEANLSHISKDLIELDDQVSNALELLEKFCQEVKSHRLYDLLFKKMGSSFVKQVSFLIPVIVLVRYATGRDSSAKEDLYQSLMDLYVCWYRGQQEISPVTQDQAL